ncbi:MAG: N-carbamoylputrescine amidase, partial [uncultured Sphingomonadaceae bacterium]
AGGVRGGGDRRPRRHPRPRPRQTPPRRLRLLPRPAARDVRAVGGGRL